MEQHPTQSILIVLFLSLVLMALTGCPNNNPPPPSDGGTPDTVTPPPDKGTQLIDCKKGNICINIGAKGIRGCDILLTADNPVSSPTITFDADLIGQSKHLGNKVALSWITKGDADPATKRFVTTLKLATGSKSLKVAKAECYNRTGTKVDNPQVTLQTP